MYTFIKMGNNIGIPDSRGLIFELMASIFPMKLD